MKNFNTILHGFLEETGSLGTIKAGEGHEKVSDQQKEKVLDNLIKESKNNVLLIYIMCAMLFLLFMVCIWFAIYYRDKPDTFKITIGGSLLGLLVIVKLLLNIWKEKSKMDVLIALIPNVTPEHTKEIIEILYIKK